MTRSEGLSQWTETLSSHMPHLSKSQALVLALWSFGIVLAQSCGISSVVCVLAPLVSRKEDALRQQLREWCYDAAHKSGAKRSFKRQELTVSTCFAPLLRWVLAWWPPTEKRLALLMDASTLGTRFTVLSLCVAYRGCAIPVAWVVLAATKKGAWQPHWKALFTHLKGVVPPDWTVIVPADRGLYARWLFRHIQELGWHPFLRINVGGNYRPHNAGCFRPLKNVVAQGGKGWSGRVTCFSGKDCQLDCTLLAHWDDGHSDAWLIVTDLPPEAADVAWYGLRPMIECGYKDAKRGGFHWEQTKMTDPARATRLWLALAVATLWVVSIGGGADERCSISMLDDCSDLLTSPQRSSKRARAHMLGCFRRGVLLIIASLISSGTVPVARFIPEPWPKTLDTFPFPVHRYSSRQKAA